MMSVLREWLRRFWGTFRKAPEDTAMEDELRLHVDMLADELQRRGRSPEDAAREARLQAGGVAQAMEQRRDQRGLPWLEDFLHDARYGARALRRAPAFTAVAIATLTLAIGANTAIFSLVDPLLFRDLPVRDPGSLVEFIWQYPADPPLNLFTLDNYELYRSRNTVFSDMAALAPLAPESRAADAPSAHVVTGNFFQMLGVQPVLGRVLDVSDDGAAASPAAVVSWRYWKNHFGADPQLLGRPITVADPRLPVPLQATVVGVAASRFAGLLSGYQPDVWISLSAVPAAARSKAGVSLVARLKPGVSIEQARAEMRVLDEARIESLARRDPQWRRVVLDVKPARAGLETPLHQQFGAPLRLLLAMVGGLLLLACANIGSMVLARGAARQHEMAVRVSLGAGRFRVVRQVVTESLLLALAGSVLGLIVARVGATALLRVVSSGTRSLAGAPRVEIPLDARVLLFTIGVSVLAAFVFGLAPAVAGLVSSPAQVLRQGGGAQPRARRVFSNGLVVAQVAISLTLLSVAQLYIDHLRHLRDRSLGFDRDGVLLVSVDMSRGGRTREQLAALYRDAASRLQAIPGVRSVAASGMTPVSGAAGSRFLRAEGFDEPAQNKSRAFLNTVSPNYFATYATSLIAGRDFRDGDTGQRFVIVNQALARHYFAGRDPLGRRVWLENEPDPYEIVGIAGDAKYQDVRVAAPPIVYLFAPLSRGSTDFSLRTGVPPTSVAAAARRVVNEVFGADSVRRVTTLADQVDAAIVPERLMAILAGFFGAVGALLAAIGLYGLLAYTVARRTREIGIRMAVGATRGKVMRAVLVDALRLVAIGLAAGALPALWGKRVAAAMLEHMSARGFGPVFIAAAGMIVVALLAAVVPARRATRVDPVIALRSE